MPDRLEERYAPNGVCFGCGPKNRSGLRLKTFPSGDRVVADWKPKPQHVAFGGTGSGGFISVLLDCSGKWASAYSLMRERNASTPPGTVTAEYAVKFLKPSPINEDWHITAWPTKINGDWVAESGELSVFGVVTVTMNGGFVAVQEEHPAFHRWR